MESRTQKRVARRRRLKERVRGVEARPRLAVFRSNTRFSAQIINDETGKTLAVASSAESKAKTPKERAVEAGKLLAKRAKDAGVSKVVFDRGGFSYIGTVAAFADAVREGGLEF